MVLSKQDIRRIENSIAEAEKKTSGELVAAVVRASGSYTWATWVWASLGWFATSLAVGVLSAVDWPFSALQLLEWQLLGLCGGLVLSLIPTLRRLLVRQKTMATQVHREALATFVAEGITRTKQRTGILIYVSEFEHRVEILADEGIHSHCGPQYWDAQVKRIVEGIRSGRGCDALCDAIQTMGEKLASHFPPVPDDVNELPNTVRTE